MRIVRGAAAAIACLVACGGAGTIARPPAGGAASEAPLSAGTSSAAPSATPSTSSSGDSAAPVNDKKAEARAHLAKGKELVVLSSKGGDKKPYAGAIAELEEAVALDPTLAEAHHELGNARFLAGDRAEAIASFARAVSLAPDRTLLYYDDLAQAEIAAGTLERALQAAVDGEQHAPKIRKAAADGADAVVIEREDVALYQLLMVQATIAAAQGNKELRIAALERTQGTRWPAARDADYQLALAYKAQSKKPQACSALARFVATPPEPQGIDHHADAKTLLKKWACKPTK